MRPCQFDRPTTLRIEVLCPSTSAGVGYDVLPHHGVDTVRTNNKKGGFYAAAQTQKTGSIPRAS